MLSIKIATVAEAELIASMSRQTFYDSFAEQNTKENMDKFLTDPFSFESLVKEVGQPGNTFMLAYDDARPVGYTRIRENNNPPELGTSNALEIARLYAIKEYIGKGVGSFLMEKAIALGKEKGKEFLWLGVWEENKRAIDFYHRWGFRKFAEHIFMLGDDPQQDWLMKKELI
jgi:ribosomal protein S18 acetylase RimI-like enzyme